jgi:hypothetical protein
LVPTEKKAASYQIRGADRRRGLYHYPGLDRPGHCSFAFKLFAAFVQDLPGRTQLLDVDDHGEHNRQVPGCSRSQDGSELRLEELRGFQAHPYAAPFQERVLFVRLLHAGQVLVPAEV